MLIQMKHQIRLFIAAIAANLLLSETAGAQDVAAGEAAYRRLCSSCHATTRDGRSPNGHLFGIVGRRAASLEGVRYSAPLTSSGITWDRTQLDAFLADPRATVPGTTMFVRVSDADTRMDMLTYLVTLK
jgi:cytochrome c